jgi:hypothetical protein
MKYKLNDGCSFEGTRMSIQAKMRCYLQICEFTQIPGTSSYLIAGETVCTESKEAAINLLVSLVPFAPIELDWRLVKKLQDLNTNVNKLQIDINSLLVNLGL